MCGEVQWSSLGRGRAAVVGYNSEGNYFNNHPFSGLSAIGDAVSCTFDIGKRRKRETDGTSLTNDVDNDPGVTGAVEDCLGAVGLDELLSNMQDPMVLADMLPSCPCERDQIIRDYARFRKLDGPGNCYVSSTPTRIMGIRLTTASNSLTQMCCYRPDTG